MIDSQSIKTTEVGDLERGYDGGKVVSGRERHVPVDTMGSLPGVAVTAASADGGIAAARFSRLEVVYAGVKYENPTAKEWLAARGGRSGAMIDERDGGGRRISSIDNRARTASAGLRIRS